MNKKKPSPSGLGIYAKNEKLKTVKKGADGKKWIVYKDCNGVKKWKLYKKIKKSGGGKHGRNNSLEEGEIEEGEINNGRKSRRIGPGPRNRLRANELNTGRFESEGNGSYPLVPNFRRLNSVGSKIDFSTIIKINYNLWDNVTRQWGRPVIDPDFQTEINNIENNIISKIRYYRIRDRYSCISRVSTNTSNGQPQFVFKLIRDVNNNGNRRDTEMIHVTIHNVVDTHSRNSSKKGIHFLVNKNLKFKTRPRHEYYYYIGILFNKKDQEFYVLPQDREILNDLTYDENKFVCNIFIEEFLRGINSMVGKII